MPGPDAHDFAVTDVDRRLFNLVAEQNPRTSQNMIFHAADYSRSPPALRAREMQFRLAA